MYPHCLHLSTLSSMVSIILSINFGSLFFKHLSKMYLTSCISFLLIICKINFLIFFYSCYYCSVAINNFSIFQIIITITNSCFVIVKFIHKNKSYCFSHFQTLRFFILVGPYSTYVITIIQFCINRVFANSPEFSFCHRIFPLIFILRTFEFERQTSFLCWWNHCARSWTKSQV